jgi:hypothetical protein
LSVFATVRQGFMVYDEFGSNYNNLFGRYNNLRVSYWTPTNPSNTHLRPNADHVDNPIYGPSRAYKDASFIRVRNITLGYTLMRRDGMLAKALLPVESLRIYASVQEPFLFTKYLGFDPESGTGNGAPSYRTLLVGLNVGM